MGALSVSGVPTPAPAFLSGADVPDYFKGVELLTAGMEWPASTSPVTITMEHIADAVRAANDDPHIQPPRIKLGHTSSVNGDHPDHDPFAAIGDAEPAFGVFGNLQAANDGAVLIGDADRVLTWLALSAPATYPNRSSEATWQVADASFDVQTAGGKRYSMVVTAVSLLGVHIPAISDLEDLSTLIMNGPSALAASTSASAADGAALSVSHSTIRDRFNWDWAVDRVGNDFDGDTTYWWARDIRLDPDEIIGDDEQGNLWSVPFTTDGKDEITFGEPARVRQDFVPVAAATMLVASFSRPSKPSRKPAASAASPIAATGSPNTEGDEPMDKSVREFLVGQGHDPDTATSEQVTAAEQYVAAFPTQPAAEADEPEATSDEPAAEGDAKVIEDREREPVAASKGELQAEKDKAFSELSARVVELTARENARLAADTKLRRDMKAQTAVAAGKITPAQLSHYRSLLDIDEDGTAKLIDDLPTGIVPLAATAMVPDPEADQFASEDGLLPDNVSLLTSGQRADLRARRGA